MTVTRFPAHGGQFQEEVDVDVTHYLDVVKLVSIEKEKQYSLIGKQNEMWVVTEPTSYASQVTWIPLDNVNISTTEGASIMATAVGPGSSSVQATLAINGASASRSGYFTGVKVIVITTPGQQVNGTIEGTSTNGGGSEKSVEPNPLGSLKFKSVPSNVPCNVIADVATTDATSYELACYGSMFRHAFAHWIYFGDNPVGNYNDEVKIEVTDGFLLNLKESAADVDVIIDSEDPGEFNFEQSSRGRSMASIRAVVSSGLVGGAWAKSNVNSVGGISWTIGVRDVE